MGNLDSVLKKLNRGKKEEEKSKVLGKNKLEKIFYSTGSPYIDYLVGGGYPGGGYNTVEGTGGTGKSSLALLACNDAIVTKNKYAVYFDGEGTLDDSYINRMCVDRSKLIVERGRSLEDMLDKAEAYATADEIGIIVLDSIPIFVSKTVEEKSAQDITMAVEARKFSARMPVLEGHCMARDITILGLNAYKLDPGTTMGDNRVLPRGRWQLTMNNVFLTLAKKKNIFDEEGTHIGHQIAIRVKKTKAATYEPTEVHMINFYYEGGINREEEYARLFVEVELVKKTSSWIFFPNKDGEEVKVQGVEKFIEHLLENKEDYEFLKKQFDERTSR
jgi:RecA/RadA recombinase